MINNIPHKAKVLFIDDEEPNRYGFIAAFRKLYDITTVETAEEGKKQLSENEFHIVICDERLPGENGSSFLCWVKEHYPDLITMLITGYDDLSPAIEAINKGEIYQYIHKPWNNDQVKIIIDQAFERYCDQKKIHNQNLQLTKAYNELDRLLYSASHDLRGPLTSILGLTRLIKNERDNSVQSTYIGMIEDSVNKLENILQGIAHFSENLKIEYKIDYIHFDELIEDVLYNVNSRELMNKNTKVVKVVSQDTDFKSDSNRIKIILEHLLRNACHFQNEEINNQTIRVEVQVHEKEANISISDNGVGFDEETADKVFQMFYRGHSQSRGAGIGLYIVKEAVERLGGSIKTESELGKGTAFNVTIPNITD
ncbi:MAG: hybrid sensor histidine kinase/response regulator [Salibacter sp.]|uniref:hybrid sensor histidine kinase/response regulator n=1 Tax=Salibacter sp. TaxID=2010995 RepID=UPI0028703546|nr:hybrid sensor histidine kinase/response regulator [Salibacter sp.]MDR9398401.1 hybrid sensor histidine kinase/response regulator [Salibacter sp.]